MGHDLLDAVNVLVHDGGGMASGIKVVAGMERVPEPEPFSGEDMRA